MKSFLFELYTDEIPAKLVNNLSLQLKEQFLQKLNSFEFDHSDIVTFATHRRLVLYIESVEEKEKDTIQEIKGPAYSIAYDKEGNAKPVLNKFLESNGLDTSQIEIREVKGSKYVLDIRRYEEEKQKK